jgi:hypothetical protein
LNAFTRTAWIVFLAGSAACLNFHLVLSAYEVSLTSAAIHDAYVLGQRNDQATADFRGPYLKQLKEEGALGPHIAQIEILTPFAQVVDQSRTNSSKGYTEQKAAEDYRRRGDIVVVRILLMLPAAYPKPDQNAEVTNPAASPSPQKRNESLRPENFWQNFRFSVKQRGKVIPSRNMRNQPIYSSATKDAPSVLDGATVCLEYDAKDVASEETTVEVLTPEAKNITAVFDLKKLR